MGIFYFCGKITYMTNYKLFTKNKNLYATMLADVAQAEKFIYLETYIYGNDKIGEQFRDLLIKKARTGVNVKIIIDDFGSEVKESFFSELIKTGGQIKFFRKFIYSLKLVSKNNSRNHRKLLTIDNKITYLGSSNIKEKHLDWHELNIRLENGIAEYFSSIFLDNFKIANKKSFMKKWHIFPVRYGLFEIIRDVPSIKFNKIRKRKIELIRQAKKQVLIETPYFLPDKKFRKALKIAVRKGVDVKIIIPKKSDVKIIDILRNRYLGNLHKNGIKIYFYNKKNLHSKFLIIDDVAFSLGSANINFRSLYVEFELNLFGWDKHIIQDLESIFENDLKSTEKFNYKKYLSRSKIQKLTEKILAKVRENL